jgi:hypothetical protein
MDRMEHSQDDLQAPTCPSCGIDMQWSGSELIRFVPATNNLNLFGCRTCLLFAESETVHEPPPARASFVGVVARAAVPGRCGGARPGTSSRYGRAGPKPVVFGIAV